MTAVSQNAETHPLPGSGGHAAQEPPPPPVDQFASPVPVANPALIGVPTFMVGSIALALNLTNYVPQGIVGAPIAIIALATAVGQTIATIFALKAGESAVACVFGVFSGFWLSYAGLVLGLLHNWYGLGTTGGLPTVKTFLLSWLIIIVLLTLVSLRLPLAFTLLFTLVDLALLFVFLGYVNNTGGVPSSGELKVGGVFAWCFIAAGAYLFLDAMSAATGGKNLPLGKPIIR